MPDGHGTLTAAELKRKLENKRDRKAKLRGLFHRAKAEVKRLTKRYRKAKAREAARRGPAKAVTWTRARLGTTEKPYGSNWGVPVQDWIKFTGYSGPVPWCGCFTCYAVVKIGGANIPSRIRLGYHGYIISDARGNRNGLRAVSVNDAKAGDIVAYDFAHIGVIVGPTQNGQVHAIEGNTSAASGGSQNNGGGVYERRRPISDVAVIARPAY